MPQGSNANNQTSTVGESESGTVQRAYAIDDQGRKADFGSTPAAELGIAAATMDNQGRDGDRAEEPRMAGLNGRLGVLRHKHFRNVFIAAFVSNIGGWMEMLGVQLIVAKETGSLKMLGYLGAAQLVPILLFGLLGGLLADRVNRKTLLVVTQAMLMLVAIAVAVVSAMPSIKGMQLVYVLMALSAINGTIMAFNVPAWQVLTPRLVPREELTAAINANGVQFNLARVIGPALAGILMYHYGITLTFALNAVSFVGVLAAVMTTPDAPALPPSGKPIAAELRESRDFIFKQRGPLAILVAMVLMSALAAPLVRMLPLYVIDVYGIAKEQSERYTGYLLAVLGIGAVTGGLLLKFIPKWYPKHHFIPMAITGSGLTVTCFALTVDVWTGYAVMFFCGIFWIWAFNQSWAAMQNIVPDNMRGRVLAIANVAAFGANAVGNVASGWLGEIVADNFPAVAGRWIGADLAKMLGPAMGAHVAVGGFSFALFVAGVVMLMRRVPEVDGLPRVARTAAGRGLVSAVLAREHWPRNGRDQGGGGTGGGGQHAA